MCIKIAFLLTVLVSLNGAENPSVNLTVLRIEDKKEVIGKWSFSSEWAGTMGCAIEFDKDNYLYWFYSDLKSDDDPKYPIRGKWKLVNGVLILDPPNAGFLYSKHWVKINYGGKIGLLNPDGLAIMVIHEKTPANRWIQKLDEPISVWPLLNLP